MNFIQVTHVNRPNIVALEEGEYHVVLTAMHADHFADTFGSAPLHDVRAIDTLRILAKSIAVLLDPINFSGS
ncbi:hypothetical protein [Tunicatimonas pelagia]|uniref:hypothetical protein n=1 Tax=Tunicatimonas pelagia TaxID=931531 RepID=UPI002665F954|nr:hypothetical protein [Tunicatimonas pelagia]WKN46066.1 hypothetical protein P0M28_14010 [Tunicatimonas pelagia]